MTKINLAALFKMKPKLASEYLKNKVSQTSWNWYDIYEKEHDKVFTVAKTAGYDVLKDIRAAVQKAIDEGQSLNSFKKELKPILKQKGWWGKVPDPSDPTKEVQLGSVRRLETIYRTNLRTSYQAGRYQSLEDNAEFRPYWQYIAVMDDRTRKEHKELHGKVFRHDDPFWENFFPPNGWNCRCTVKSLSQKDLDRLGLTVESSKGKILNATAELPDGTKVQGKVYRTNGKIIQTDVGWNYNPGRSTYQPHDDGKDPELKAKFDEVMRSASSNSIRINRLLNGFPNLTQFNIEETLKEKGVEYLRIKPLKEKLTSEQIVSHVSGNDNQGSCQSITFSYIGVKLGFNVRDFRGGESRKIFMQGCVIKRLCSLAKGKSEYLMNDFDAAKNLFKFIEPNKEYCLSVGEHTAIVRKNKGKIQYLELQIPHKIGWHELSETQLKVRFLCHKTHSTFGVKHPVTTSVFDIENLKGNKEFENFLGYLNTVKDD